VIVSNRNPNPNPRNGEVPFLPRSFSRCTSSSTSILVDLVLRISSRITNILKVRRIGEQGEDRLMAASVPAKRTDVPMLVYDWSIER
jgi:hypothetical protein